MSVHAALSDPRTGRLQQTKLPNTDYSCHIKISCKIQQLERIFPALRLSLLISAQAEKQALRDKIHLEMFIL